MSALNEIEPWTPLTVITANPLLNNPLLNTCDLRLISIDRPPQPEGGTFLIAKLIVPIGRENDSLFSSLPGQIRLLNQYFNVDRLVLISNEHSVDIDSNHSYSRTEVDELALKEAQDGLFVILSMFEPVDRNFRSEFVSFEDCLVFRRFLAGHTGKVVGAFTLVDEVVTDSVGSQMMSIRRRLRFETTPNWLQADVKMFVKEDNRQIKNEELDINNIHKYYISSIDFGMLDRSSSAAAMLYGLTLRSPSSSWIARLLDGSVLKEEKALCLGVRGVVVPLFLHTMLGFKVIGIEPDDDLINPLRSFFAIPGKIKILCHPISEFIEALVKRKPNTGLKWKRAKEFMSDDFSLITLDFSTFNRCSSSGMCVCAPPQDIATKETFKALKSRLCPYGAFVMHTIAPHYLFFQDLLADLKQIFPRVFVLNMGSETEFVIVALNGSARTPPDNDSVKQTVMNLLPAFSFKEV